MRADLIGLDWSGILLHDGWSPYNLFKEADHQQCLAYILRRIHEFLETAVGVAVVFPRAVRDRHALGEISDHGKLVRAGQLEGVLARLVTSVKTNPDNERLASFQGKHLYSLFRLLKVDGVEATNWPGEQAIRQPQRRWCPSTRRADLGDPHLQTAHRQTAPILANTLIPLFGKKGGTPVFTSYEDCTVLYCFTMLCTAFHRIFVPYIAHVCNPQRSM